MKELIIILTLIFILCLPTVLYLFDLVCEYKKENIELQTKYDTLLSQKKSSEVRLGQISEQLAPFLKEFPYDPKKAHFLGNPIDYVVFNEDGIVFLEVKSGESKLSKSQKDIKSLIDLGKVKFETLQIK